VIIRTLAEADVETFRRFRLAALRESPLSFGASAEGEAALPADEWTRRLSSERGAVYGGFDAAGTLVGTLGVYVLEGDDDRSGPWLWSMYVLPTARRLGIARQLMRHVVDDLLARGERRPLRLHVTNASAFARALYESFGFEVTRQECDVPWHSGQTVDRAEMRLCLAGEV
jgi:ribosomal protein S18 acetylase RimI-like enzyme